ncbi:MAG: putative lipid II flippase FtsW [Pleurocapsa minor GSE-CHR-MK-17-07R]|jgi:cell division protein FtsW|nr:putative lipid II flippase FtsW [Pleurocapsa minor GSE-CHR-MK 17-07R]
MAQQAIPEYSDLDAVPLTNGRVVEPVRGMANADIPAAPRVITRRKGFLSTLDTPLVIVFALLLAIGALMVYSTTFDWSYSDFGSETVIVMQHMRNMAIGLVVLLGAAIIDYRKVRAWATIFLLVTVGALIAVLLFSDQVFGARRAFFGGSFQPGEAAELVMVIYMAAWLSSKNRKVHSFWNGLVPFGILLAIVGGLVALQPDISTAITIFLVTGIMYFLAGANLYYLVAIIGGMGLVSYLVSSQLGYAQDRIESFTAGLSDLSQTAYHAQQAIIAFINGGWTGVGLGQGSQKFGFLPAPHTDSIFAVIGEELGVVGAGFVVLLFVVLIMRGLQIARNANDPFGMLLAGGITLWIITKALLNIAVMLSLVPPTGVALPFISFGGSSLTTVMFGAGLLLSVARFTAIQNSPEGRANSATDDRGWGNRWTRLSSPRGSRSRTRTGSGG